METTTAIRTRRSMGRLGGDVSDDTVTALIDLAVMAPNHRMTEPWQFTVITGPARESLGWRWADAIASASSLTGEALDAYKTAEARKFLRAPVLVVVSVATTPGDEVRSVEDMAATAAAIQNLLLAAWAGGLGTRWRTGAMAYHPAFRKLLGLDEAQRILGVIYLGYPELGKEPPPAPARTKSGAVRWYHPPREA
ncbi:MAG: nitroreductase [Thermaerobacter sp.]|nr:nitroreductase [Thermaerobacter sp.]